MGRPYLFWNHEPVYYIVGSTDHFANMKYRQAIMPLHLDTNVMKRMPPLTHSQIFLTQKPDFEFLVEQTRETVFNKHNSDAEITGHCKQVNHGG